MLRPAHATLLAAALATVALTAAPSTASADFGEGAFHVGAGPMLLSVEHLPEPDYTVAIYGILPTSWLTGVHLGFMVTPEIYLGAQLTLGGTSTIATGPFGGSANIDQIFFAFLPRFLYFLGITDAANLYFGAEAGISIYGDPDGDPEDVFKVGGIFGLAHFVTDALSVGGEVTLSFTHHPDSANAGFQVALNFILGGWIGGPGTGSSGGGGGDAGAPEPAPAPASGGGGLYNDPEGGMQ